MATIDVGDNDQVFVFTRSSEPNPPEPMTHELSKNDLMIVIERQDLPHVPSVKIYVGGEQVGLVQDLNLKASSSDTMAKLEVKLICSEVEALSEVLKTNCNKYLELLKRLLPFINIKEIDFKGQVLYEHGMSIETTVTPRD